MQRREHAQPQQVEFDQTDCRTVVFVPLQHTATRHPGPLHRADVGDRPIADDHSPEWIPICRGRSAICTARSTTGSGIPEIGRSGHRRPTADPLAPGILLALREPQRPRRVAHRTAAAVGDHIGHLRGVVAAVAGVDVLDDLLAQVRLDVDVDIGRSVTGRREEPLEEQSVGHRIDGGNPECIADRRVGSRAPALAQDVVAPAELGDVVHHQEITRELQLGDDLQFPLDLRVGARRTGPRPVALPGADHDQLTQPAVLGVPVGNVERR